MKINIEITADEAKECKAITVSDNAGTMKPAVGDVHNFRLTSGEEAQFMITRVDDDGYLCMLVDCLPDTYQMNETNTTDGGYDASCLRKKMQEEILDLFPAELREKMVPVYKGDLITIPSEKEVFGTNRCGKEDPCGKQLEPMKRRRNRIAFRGKDDGFEWYWLRDVVSAAYFASVDVYGGANCSNASNAYGVRPAFKIKYL